MLEISETELTSLGHRKIILPSLRRFKSEISIIDYFHCLVIVVECEKTSLKIKL